MASSRSPKADRGDRAVRHRTQPVDWAQEGTFYLMGINEQVVFEPFPVEVSDDFNTIKVKTAVYEGADYFMGAGYLISSSRVSLAFIGTSEMTLTRKADGNTVLNQGLRMPGRIPNSRLRNRAACSNGFPAKRFIST